MAAPPDPETRLQTVLDVLDDPDCRALLRTLHATPERSRQELAEACALARTTAYRKVDRLVEADLVRPTTELRDDGHHTTRYVVAFDGVTVSLDEDSEFSVDVARPEPPDSPDERLARYWRAMRESR
ncbi:winged helix-turn-helix domain-containing protein [Halomarina rubra]|uniref:Helix-turn-helix domain-containing protein n=1 Tax=Halomarina rubra TaxID=2071873 RepID=A0ABD6B0P4_9EURY|nr:helix-turn-helix domain-containing protein [Halomarina rubra]